MDIVRRNPKSFLSEKVGLLIIESRILIFKRWLVIYDGLASPGVCITKAITFEKRIPHFRNSIAGHRLSEVLQNQMIHTFQGFDGQASQSASAMEHQKYLR